MDTVEDIKGGKVMLTLLFVTYNFMLIFLLDFQTKEEVIKNKIPYQAILNIFTKDELLKLGVCEIEPDKVNLTKKIISSK